MDGSAFGINLASEPDFTLAGLSVSPSACRLTGGGRELRVEAKTMAVLVVLARALGGTVTRDGLIETCWDGRVVSDDAIARTIAKVRSLARMVTPAPFTLETVPKVGYRLVAAGAAAENTPPRSMSDAALVTARVQDSPRQTTSAPLRSLLANRWAPAGIVAAALLAAPFLWGAVRDGSHGYDDAPPYAPLVMDALMNADEQRLALYIRRGWNPNWKLDTEGNAALHQVMMVCERNPTHDQAGLTRLVRFLVERGADPTVRNGWGDTPLMIGESPHYCGPDHPVVAYLNELPENTSPQHLGVLNAVPKQR